MIPVLGQDPNAPFPPVERALHDPPGLLAMGGDLSPARLVNAYRRGIFPWYSEGQPILWWSPAPRCVLFPGEVHVSRRLRRRYNRQRPALTADRAFERVIEGCARDRQDQEGTWITRDMVSAYTRLFGAGIAHSVETWLDGELVGGIYGVALGRVFFGESMYSDSDDASKIALVALCRQLADWGFSVLDCQVSNAHLRSMGAREISRAAFEDLLRGTDEADRWRSGFHCADRW